MFFAISRPPAADSLRFSLSAGRKKNSASPQTVFTSLSANICDAQRKRLGPQKINNSVLRLVFESILTNLSSAAKD